MADDNDEPTPTQGFKNAADQAAALKNAGDNSYLNSPEHKGRVNMDQNNTPSPDDVTRFMNK